MKLYRVPPRGKGGRSQTGAHTPGALRLPHAPHAVPNAVKHAARFAATPTTVGVQVPPLQQRQSQLPSTCAVWNSTSVKTQVGQRAGIDGSSICTFVLVAASARTLLVVLLV